MPNYKLRLMYRRPIEDSDARFEMYVYETDLIDLPDGSIAAKFAANAKDVLWMPELIGGEWVKEEACQS